MDPAVNPCVQENLIQFRYVRFPAKYFTCCFPIDVDYCTITDFYY